MRGGQLILTPVRIQRGDAVRAKLEELDLKEEDMLAAVAWGRAAPAAPVMVNEPEPSYAVKPAKPKKSAAKKAKTNA
jgi:hypothetical protein